MSILNMLTEEKRLSSAKRTFKQFLAALLIFTQVYTPAAYGARVHFQIDKEEKTEVTARIRLKIWKEEKTQSVLIYDSRNKNGSKDKGSIGYNIHGKKCILPGIRSEHQHFAPSELPHTHFNLKGIEGGKDKEKLLVNFQNTFSATKIDFNFSVYHDGCVVIQQLSSPQASKLEISLQTFGDIFTGASEISLHSLSLSGKNVHNETKLETRAGLTLTGTGKLQNEEGGSLESESTLDCHFSKVENKGEISAVGALTFSPFVKTLRNFELENSGSIFSEDATLSILSASKVINHGLLRAIDERVMLDVVQGENHGAISGKQGIELTIHDLFTNFKHETDSILGSLKYPAEKILIKGAGLLRNHGLITSEREIQLRTNLENYGHILAPAGTTILALQRGQNWGQIKGKGKVDLTIGQVFKNDNEISSEETIRIQGAGDFHNRSNGILRGGETLHLTDVHLTNEGAFVASQVIKLFDLRGLFENTASGQINSDLILIKGSAFKTEGHLCASQTGSDSTVFIDVEDASLRGKTEARDILIEAKRVKILGTLEAKKIDITASQTEIETQAHVKATETILLEAQKSFSNQGEVESSNTIAAKLGGDISDLGQLKAKDWLFLEAEQHPSIQEILLGRHPSFTQSGGIYFIESTPVCLECAFHVPYGVGITAPQISLTGSLIGKEIVFRAERITLKTLVRRIGPEGNYRDTLPTIAFLHASAGDLTVEAIESLLARGALFEAAQNIRLISEGTLTLASQKLESEKSTSSKRHSSHCYGLTHHKTQVKAGQDAILHASQAMILEGADTIAGKDIHTQSKASSLTLKSVHNVFHEEHHTQSKKKKGIKRFCKKKKSRTDIKESAIPVSSTFIAGSNLCWTAHTDLQIQAPHITANGSATFTSEQGHISLSADQSITASNQQKHGKNKVWQSQKSKERSNKQIAIATIQANGGLKATASCGMKVELAQSVKRKKSPALAWIKDLEKQVSQGTLAVEWVFLKGEQKKKSKKTHGLMPAASISLGLVAGIATGGLGTAFAGAAGITGTAASIASAGVQVLSSQAIVSMVNRKGNIFQTLKDLGSKQTAAALAIEMGTAGIGGALKLPAQPQGVRQHLQSNLVRSGVKTTIDVLQGKSLPKALREGVTNTVVDTLAAVGANEIGDMRQRGELNFGEHKALHAFSGVFHGMTLEALRGGDLLRGAGTGATGAVLGETVAETTQSTVGREIAAHLGRTVPVFTALFTGQDADIVAITANNAITHNLLHPAPTLEIDQNRKEATDAFINSATDVAQTEIQPLKRAQDVTSEQAEKSFREASEALKNQNLSWWERASLLREKVTAFENMGRIQMLPVTVGEVTLKVVGVLGGTAGNAPQVLKPAAKLFKMEKAVEKTAKAEQKAAKVGKGAPSQPKASSSSSSSFMTFQKPNSAFANVQELTMESWLSKPTGTCPTLTSNLPQGSKPIKIIDLRTTTSVAKAGKAEQQVVKGGKSTSSQPKASVPASSASSSASLDTRGNWAAKEGKEWRDKIIGKAQKTGGKTRETQTGEHAVRSYREAITAAKREEVDKVYLNRGYKKATGESITPNRRSDVTIVRKDGKVDAIEVQSKTDDPAILWQRNDEALRQLPPERQGEIWIIKPTEDLK